MAATIGPGNHDPVYASLRAQIIGGGLAPGAPLRLGRVAAQFGVSTMPIRSALARLEADGLIVQARHRGATVAPLSLDDLEEIQAVRSGIEGFAARLGAEYIDAGHVERMQISLVDAREQLATMPLDAYLAFQWRFHT